MDCGCCSKFAIVAYGFGEEDGPEEEGQGLDSGVC